MKTDVKTTATYRTHAVLNLDDYQTMSITRTSTRGREQVALRLNRVLVQVLVRPDTDPLPYESKIELQFETAEQAIAAVAALAEVVSAVLSKPVGGEG